MFNISKQFDRTRFTEDCQLTEILYQCHRQLSSLAIPVAPLDQIEIYFQTYKGSNPPNGCCYRLKSGSFVITINKRLSKESREDRYYTKSVVCHELLHSISIGEGRRLSGHGEDFRYYAKQIKSTYGYNLFLTFAGMRYEHASSPLLRSAFCSCCGSVVVFHDYPEGLARLKSWEKEMDSEKGVHCAICGGRMVWDNKSGEREKKGG